MLDHRAATAPPFTAAVEVPRQDPADTPFRELPAKAGVFLLEDETGATLALTITADVRRAVRTRLTEPNPRRSVDPHMVRVIRAITVGSAFEAEWVYLQLARERLPHSYRGMLDRWRGWFVHGHPNARFPRWVKTSNPGSPPTGRKGVYLGPFPDKHAAQRFMELLDNAFDLCRYHHLLIEAPNATACVYKEMGKCPAPCDGSVSMESYRAQVSDAVRFASTPIEEYRHALEQRMGEAGAATDFEAAQSIRRQLERTAGAAKPEFRFVDRLERFLFLAVLPSEKADWARLILINGGRIEPIADAPIDAGAAALEEIITVIEGRIESTPFELNAAAVENIGLVCQHLFRGRTKRKAAATFLSLRVQLTAADLRKTLRQLARQSKPNEPDSDFGEQTMEA